MDERTRREFGTTVAATAVGIVAWKFRGFLSGQRPAPSPSPQVRIAYASRNWYAGEIPGNAYITKKAVNEFSLQELSAIFGVKGKIPGLNEKQKRVLLLTWLKAAKDYRKQQQLYGSDVDLIGPLAISRSSLTRGALNGSLGLTSVADVEDLSKVLEAAVAAYNQLPALARSQSEPFNPAIVRNIDTVTALTPMGTNYRDAFQELIASGSIRGAGLAIPPTGLQIGLGS